MIAAGNRIAKKPYKYGGGHAKLRDSGYDCSGSVSYALRGGKLMRGAMDSGGFMRWGRSGRGTWITIRANRGHAYMIVAGLRFDTSGRSAARHALVAEDALGPRLPRPAPRRAVATGARTLRARLRSRP